MFDRKLTLDRVDPAVWAAIQQEDTRQEQHIELIASENYASPAVMQAQGTQITFSLTPVRRRIRRCIWRF